MRYEFTLRSYAPEVTPTIMNPPDLNSNADWIMWRWGSSGDYSAKSAYKTLTSGGMIRWAFNNLWSAKCPSSDIIFVYLMLRERTLTQELLLRRKTNVQVGCVMCQCRIVQTAIDLFFECPYAVQVRRTLEAQMNISLFKPDATEQQIWLSSLHGVRNRHRMKEATWIAWFMGVTWLIWKQRNESIFKSKELPLWLLVDKIMVEGNLWLRHC